MPTSYEKKVTAGFRLLTKRLGPGWSKKIRLGKLDQDHHANCLLGQLFGSFGEGLRILLEQDIQWFEPAAESYALRYGFAAAAAIEGNYDEPTVRVEWTALTEEWKRQLRLHRTATKKAAA